MSSTFRSVVVRSALHAGLVLHVASASAQSTAPSPGTALLPLLTPLRLRSPGEPTATGGTAAPSFVALPIELSLLGTVFPVLNGQLGQDCTQQAEASGNQVQGFAMQRAVILPLAPRLSLHGFSRGGCALDAGLGGAASYTLPLSDRLWLVSSVGLFAQPVLPSSSRVTTDARVDLMMNPSSSHPFSIGVGTRQRGFTFTGRW